MLKPKSATVLVASGALLSALENPSASLPLFQAVPISAAGLQG